MLNKKKNNNNKGFTLIELLVVIAIIGILAVVAVPALFKNIEKGKIAELESDISAIRSASLSYYADNSAYPVDVEDIKGEIESLGLPFDDEYTLDGTAPGELTLSIDSDKISQSGLDKLENDLGDSVKTGSDIGNGQKIIITLINSSN